MTVSKNILILGIYPPPFGGISTHLKNLIPSLVRNDFNVHVFSAGYSGGTFDEEGLFVYKPSIRELFSLRYFVSGAFIKYTIYMYRRGLMRLGLRRTIKISTWIHYLRRRVLKQNKIDVICSFHLLDRGLTSAVISEMYCIPSLVINLGEIYVDTQLYKNNVNAIKYIIRNSSRMVSASKHCANSFKLLDVTVDVEVIYSGINESIFTPENSSKAISNKYDFKDHDFVVLFVGRMIYDMGLDHLLKIIPSILNENKRIRFLIVGAKGELTDNVIMMKQNYKDNVHYVIDASFEDLPKYYVSSDLVITPTADDRACMGLAIKEAMFSGVAVVGNKVGGIPEAIVHEKTGLVIDTSDEEVLGQAILRLERDRELCARMGKAGHLRASKYFSTKISNKKYLDIISSLIEKKKERSLDCNLFE